VGLGGIKKRDPVKIKIAHTLHLHTHERENFEQSIVWRAEFFNADGWLGYTRILLWARRGTGSKANLDLIPKSYLRAQLL
jgi:hypothetical protein